MLNKLNPEKTITLVNSTKKLYPFKWYSSIIKITPRNKLIQQCPGFSGLYLLYNLLFGYYDVFFALANVF
jgi:hypothetical protein